MKLDKFLKMCVYCIIHSILTGLLLDLYLTNTPVVYWSYSKNECVKVYIEGDLTTCSDIDFKNDRYRKVWVK